MEDREKFEVFLFLLGYTKYHVGVHLTSYCISKSTVHIHSNQQGLVHISVWIRGILNSIFYSYAEAKEFVIDKLK